MISQTRRDRDELVGDPTGINVAVWPLTPTSAVGVAVVRADDAAQVEPSQTSADERKSVLLDEPPTTRTCLLSGWKMAVRPGPVPW